MARLLLGLGGELGPDALPVVGAQVAARHFPNRETLNRCAMLDWDWPASGAPLVDERRGNAHIASKSSCTARVIPIQVAVQVHG